MVGESLEMPNPSSEALPISDAAVFIEDALRQFLLKGMASDLFFVDLDAQAGAIVWADGSRARVKVERLFDDFATPRDVRMNRFADDVGRRGEAQLQRGGGAHGALRVVRRECDAVSLGQRGDAPGFAQPAAV